MSSSTQRVYGRIPVLESLRAGKRVPRRLFLLNSSKGLEDIRVAAGRIEIIETGRAELDRLVEGANHQGVVLDTGALPTLDLDTWLSRNDSPNLTLVVLDSIEDPQNFGAIVRSACATGASGAIFPKAHSAPLSASVCKAAAGAMEHIDLIQVPNLVRALEDLKDANFWITGLDAEGDKAIWEVDLTGRTALVIGNEGKGMRRLVQEKCDFLAKIPIQGPITSLNASASAAIALAECLRQRSK